MENLSCGVELTAVPDIVQALDDAKMEGFDFVALPIAHPRSLPSLHFYFFY